MTQIPYACHSRVLSDSPENCAWNFGALESRLFRGGANVGSESSSSCWEVRPACSISGIVGFVNVGPLGPCTVCCHDSSAAWASRRHSLAVRFSESSRASKTSRAERGCNGRSPAVAAPRIMLRICGLAATRAPRCAGWQRHAFFVTNS